MSEQLAQLEKKGGGGKYSRSYVIGVGHTDGYGHSQVTTIDLKANTATCEYRSSVSPIYTVDDDYITASGSLTSTENMVITLKQPALVVSALNGVLSYNEYPATTTLTYNLAKGKLLTVGVYFA